MTNNTDNLLRTASMLPIGDIVKMIRHRRGLSPQHSIDQDRFLTEDLAEKASRIIQSFGRHRAEYVPVSSFIDSRRLPKHRALPINSLFELIND